MGKVAKHVEGRAQQERVRVRKQLGSLKNLTVQPSTRRRYDAARRKFLFLLNAEGLEVPTKREFLDDLVADYLEHLWSTGAGRAPASDTVASLQDFDPKLKGMLPGSWRLLKTWNISEIPNRAPPCPRLFCMLWLASVSLQETASWPCRCC